MDNVWALFVSLFFRERSFKSRQNPGVSIWRQPRPQGAFPWLWKEPGKRVLGTRLATTLLFLFSRYCICPFIQQVHKKMCLHNSARAKVAFVDFKSLRQISLLLSPTKTYKASSAHFNSWGRLVGRLMLLQYSFSLSLLSMQGPLQT